MLNERREGVILDGIDAAARPKVKDGMMEMRRSCGQRWNNDDMKERAICCLGP